MPPGLPIPPGASDALVAAVLDRLEAVARGAGLPPGTVDRIVLVAGEIIANALEHTDDGATVALDATPTGATLRVTGGDMPPAPLPPAEATSGRGLFLIHALSDGVAGGPGYSDVAFRIRPRDNPLLQ